MCTYDFQSTAGIEFYKVSNTFNRQALVIEWKLRRAPINMDLQHNTPAVRLNITFVG